jgi:hypothetical protein
MNEEIKEDSNCIIKAFENNNISIIHENINNKKSYWFKAADVAKILNLTNIRVSIQNYDDSEKGVRKAYTPGGNQEIMYLSSQGIYRLLYSSKKEIAKQFSMPINNNMISFDNDAINKALYNSNISGNTLSPTERLMSNPLGIRTQSLSINRK